MSEHLSIQFTSTAKRELDKLGRTDAVLLPRIRAFLLRLEENGWALGVRSAAIKTLRPRSCIGEIRYVGKSSHRFFMFWVDRADVREVWVSRIAPKSAVVSRRRLSSILDAVEKVRDRFLEEQE